MLRSVLPKSRVGIEVGYRIGKGWIIPDVSVLWPDQRVERGYLARAPQVAVEVLSPSNKASEVERKITLYFSEGASELWVLDPRHKSLLVYEVREGHVFRMAVEGSFSSPAAGLTFDVATLFE